MAVTAPPPPKPEDGVIKEARRREHLRRAGFAGASLLILAGLAVGVLALFGGRSSARRGARGDQKSASAKSPARLDLGIRLSPSLAGGTYGWCMAVEEGSGITGGPCGVVPVANRPLANGLSVGDARRWELIVLTAPEVASVVANGARPVPTLAPSSTTFGLRVARIVLPVEVRRSRPGKPEFRLAHEPKLLPLNAQGNKLASPELGATALPGGSVDLAAHGPCSLSISGLPGLTQQWSHVASAISPYPGRLVGRAFFSCIDVGYSFQKWPSDAAILLDAAHPGVPPAPIPGLKAVDGHPGFFNGPGAANGELSAIRRGNAWLVVAGGKDLDQRLEVLRHLTATVRYRR